MPYDFGPPPEAAKPESPEEKSAPEEKKPDADILIIVGPIWLGDNSSVTKRFIERIYSLSGMLNDKGQYLFYGRVAGCLITGNEDGIKHCAQNVLYSLQHLGSINSRIPAIGALGLSVNLNRVSDNDYWRDFSKNFSF